MVLSLIDAKFIILTLVAKTIILLQLLLIELSFFNTYD